MMFKVGERVEIICCKVLYICIAYISYTIFNTFNTLVRALDDRIDRTHSVGPSL